jgi:hypothetical protein
VFQRIAFALFKPGRLKVFGDGLEFADDRTRRSAPPVGCLIETVIEVIVDQRLFRLANRLFDRVELLRQIDARPTLIDHGNDASQVTLGALQPLDDLRVALMNESLFQLPVSYPPRQDTVNCPAVNCLTGVRRP